VPAHKARDDGADVASDPVDQKRLVKTSKYLSRHLRHQPERLGIELEPGGWVRVDELLRALQSHSFRLTFDELCEVVANNDKRRFSFDESRTRIRANQGHSIDVDLGLPAVPPPPVLFHGTAERSLDAIFTHGLRSMGRHHVHLSRDVVTARAVGKRHGRPVVLRVAAAEMAAAGFDFFVTQNHVWLTEAVPPEYLKLVGETVGVRDGQ
jgi:putative RNA 2'-phosphotransferase